MKQVPGSGLERSVPDVLRRTLRQVGFREGLIVAFRHDGRISKVKVCGTARQDSETALPTANGVPRLSVEELAQLLLQQLNEALRDWAFRYGKFKFRIAGMNVVHTTFSVGIRPQEEALLLPFCRGSAVEPR